MRNKYIDIIYDESLAVPKTAKTNEYSSVIEKTFNTYISKNIDYGDSFAELYNKFGLLSTVIRLTDKIKRLESLVEGEQQVDDESIDDTLEDLINYAIMTLIERRLDNDKT